MADEVKPDLSKEEQPKPEYSSENMPKSKDEWNALKGSNPEKWSELTQLNVDKLYRQNKELQEQKAFAESEKLKIENNLRYVQQQRQEQPQNIDDKNWGYNNLPKTKEDWDNLAIEDPTLHTDLRYQYNQSQRQEIESFGQAQYQARKVVQKEHPDMYVLQTDDMGNPKKDENGNFLLKLDPSTNEPIFNPNSEKGKLWGEIFQEDPTIGNSRKAPVLLMAEMERRLRLKGKKTVEEANQEREKMVKEGQVAPSGVTPSKPVKVTFKNDEEKRHAEASVARGTFSNIEEYVTFRDRSDYGIYEENRRPVFNK